VESDRKDAAYEALRAAEEIMRAVGVLMDFARPTVDADEDWQDFVGDHPELAAAKEEPDDGWVPFAERPIWKKLFYWIVANPIYGGGRAIESLGVKIQHGYERLAMAGWAR
jgi:hypothetical protein